MDNQRLRNNKSMQSEIKQKNKGRIRKMDNQRIWNKLIKSNKKENKPRRVNWMKWLLWIRVLWRSKMKLVNWIKEKPKILIKW